MKLIEKILIFVFFVALALKFNLIVGGSVLLVFSLFVLSLLYLFLGFVVFNNIKFLRVFKGESYRGISALRIIYCVFAGFSISALLNGILFKLMYWPGGVINIFIGLLSCLAIVVAGLVKYIKNKERIYQLIFIRFIPFILIGTILAFMSNVELVKIQYRNHPAYVQAYVDYSNNPENQEKEAKMELERDRAVMLPEEFKHFHPEEN